MCFGHEMLELPLFLEHNYQVWWQLEETISLHFRTYISLYKFVFVICHQFFCVKKAKLKLWQEFSDWQTEWAVQQTERNNLVLGVGGTSRTKGLYLIGLEQMTSFDGNLAVKTILRLLCLYNMVLIVRPDDTQILSQNDSWWNGRESKKCATQGVIDIVSSGKISHLLCILNVISTAAVLLFNDDCSI